MYDHRVLRHVPHLVFFLVVGAALVRLTALDIALCWDIVTVSALLATTYAAGLALWHRLGPLARHAWAAALVAWWAVLVTLTPPLLTNAYVWCAVPWPARPCAHWDAGRPRPWSVSSRSSWSVSSPGARAASTRRWC